VLALHTAIRLPGDEEDPDLGNRVMPTRVNVVRKSTVVFATFVRMEGNSLMNYKIYKNNK
jgi:hypothetical protein